jgi:DUF4097 and DUF4098 domain-containing protein YvlB
VSGDVDIARAAGDMRARTVSGDVSLDHVAGNLDIETRSGDVELVAAVPVAGNLTTVSGDITIALPTDADVQLELQCEEDGDIEVDDDLPHEMLEQHEGYMKVKFGAGSRVLTASTHSADIDVSAAEEE